LTIRAAQASSFVFSPAGIVLEKATPKLRKRQVVGIFGHQNLGDRSLGRQAALD